MEELRDFLAADLVPAFEVVGTNKIASAEDIVHGPRLLHTRAHGTTGKDWIVTAGLDQQGPRRDETGEIVHFTELRKTRHEVARAVRHGQNAVLECREVAADDAGPDPLIYARGEQRVHAASGYAHGAQASHVNVVARL